MDTYKKYFEEHTALWLLEGFETKAKVLRAVAAGDKDSIPEIAAEYTNALVTLVGEDLIYAKDCAFFIFAQVSAAGTINGLEDWAAYRLKEGYYYAVDDADSVLDVLALIYLFILDFSDAVYRSKVESGYSPVIRAACEYIYLHIGEKLTIQALADELHFSESYIAHKFKKEVGTTIMDYLIRLRIDEAKAMLHQKIPPVDVAQQLGFSSQSHFTRVFHERTGMTPREWRKQT